MKNVNESRLKKAIFLTIEEFKDILRKTCGEKSEVDFGLDGLSYGDENGSLEAVHKKLEEYFGVREITSIHADGCDWLGVWVVYKDDGENDTPLLQFLKKEIPFRCEDIIGAKDVPEDVISDIVNEIYDNPDCMFDYDRFDDRIRELLDDYEVEYGED